MPDSFCTNDRTTTFIKQCHLCKNDTYTCKKCGLKYLNIDSVANDNVIKAISISSFNACIKPYLCKDCHQKKCFICGKHHQPVTNCRRMYCSVCNQKWTILAPKCRSSDINKRLCESCTEEAGILANLSLGFEFVTETHMPNVADIILQLNSNTISSTNQHDITDVLNNPASNNNDLPQQPTTNTVSSNNGSSVNDEDDSSDERSSVESPTQVNDSDASLPPFSADLNTGDYSGVKFDSRDIINIPAKELKRFRQHNNPHFELFNGVPENSVNEIRNLFQDSFGIESTEPRLFTSRPQAKEYFLRRFTFARDSDDLMQFEYPSGSEYLTEDVFSDEPKFSFNFNDIKSLFDRNPISEDVIDMVMDAFNFYNMSSVNEDGLVPETIFGFCNDISSVVVSKKSYPYINSFYKNLSDKPTLRDFQLYQRHWYAKNNKGFLTEILDKYHAQKKKISNYVFSQSFNDGIYVYFKVSFNTNSNLPKDQKVSSIDFYGNHESKNKHIRVWFAKFFGLYLKEMNNEIFTREDFNGQDISAAMYQQDELKIDTIDKSIISNESVKTNQLLTSRHNSGILVMGACLADIKGVDKNEFLGTTKREQSEFCYNFRLQILSFMAGLYKIIYGTHYDKLEDHLMMKNVDWTDEHYLDKWYMIHRLIDGNQLQINLKQGINANTIMQSMKTKVVKAKYNHMLNPDKNPGAIERVALDEETLNARRETIARNKHNKINLQPFWLRKEPNKRTKRIHDISHKQIIMCTDITYRTMNQVPETYVYSPSDIVKELTNILDERYCDHGESILAGVTRKNEVFDIMKMHTTYCIYDCENKEEVMQEKFVPVCLVVVEESILFQNGETCVIIHYFANEFGYEDTNHQYLLLNAIFNQSHMKATDITQDRTVVFVFQPGPYQYQLSKGNDTSVNVRDMYTPSKVFGDMKFVVRDLPSIEKDILPNSLTMIGYASDIRSYCKSKVHGSEKLMNIYLNTHRILKIDNDNKVKYRYTSTGNIEVFSHSFGWQLGTTRDYDALSSTKKKHSKNNPNVAMNFDGFGARGESDNIEIGDFNKAFPINLDFQQQKSDITSNNCVWLSTACLVRNMDPTDADIMISNFQKNRFKYEWLKFREPKDTETKIINQNSNIESLELLLSRDIGYCLRKVTKIANCYMNQLVKSNMKGKYIVQLQFNNGQGTHVVGIDKDINVIYDCMEDCALNLTKASLNYCSGKQGLLIESIPICYKLEDNNKKRSHRETKLTTTDTSTSNQMSKKNKRRRMNKKKQQK